MPTSILLVEPVATERITFKKAIANTDYVICHEASHAENLVKVYEEYHPDIVVLSIVQPGKGGLNALEELKSFDNKIIALMTFNPSKGSFLVSRTIASGAAGYIRKPFNAEQILEKLAQVKKASLAADATNKRKKARLAKPLVVHFKSSGLLAKLFLFKETAISTDVSASGLGLKTRKEHGRGDILALSIYLPYMATPVSAQGIVRNVQTIADGKSYRIGVEFQTLSKADMDRINGFVIQMNTFGEKWLELKKPFSLRFKNARNPFPLWQEGSAIMMGITGFSMTWHSALEVGSKLKIRIPCGEGADWAMALGQVGNVSESLKEKLYNIRVLFKDIQPIDSTKIGELIRGRS